MLHDATKLTCYYDIMSYMDNIRPLRVSGFQAKPAIMKSAEIKGPIYA